MKMKIVPQLLVVALVASEPLTNAQVALAESKGCPPGLAKKHPPCVPPGQAMKGITTDQWLSRDRNGEVVDRDNLIFLDDLIYYDLPPLPHGQRYAVVDDRIVVIDLTNYQILQLIRVLTTLGK